MTSADEILTEALHERGMRVTPQRVLIHRLCGSLGRHVTAEQVLERVSVRLPNASLPTVYAALELFEELGMVRRLAAGSGAALWIRRTDAHHHLVSLALRGRRGRGRPRHRPCCAPPGGSALSPPRPSWS